MLQIVLAVFFVFSFGLSAEVLAQSSQQKAQNLLETLSKSKYKKKEKGNFSFEKYIDIKSEAAVKNNVRDYAGSYVSPDANYRLDLKVSANGAIEGSGFDWNFNSEQKQNFTLQNARIDGALLTATKVFDGGKTEQFEAVFSNQTRIEGKNPNQIESRETKYGLGFVKAYGDSTNRVFLEFK